MNKEETYTVENKESKSKSFLNNYLVRFSNILSNFDIGLELLCMSCLKLDGKNPKNFLKDAKVNEEKEQGETIVLELNTLLEKLGNNIVILNNCVNIFNKII